MYAELSIGNKPQVVSVCIDDVCVERITGRREVHVFEPATRTEFRPSDHAITNVGAGSVSEVGVASSTEFVLDDEQQTAMRSFDREDSLKLDFCVRGLSTTATRERMGKLRWDFQS